MDQHTSDQSLATLFHHRWNVPTLISLLDQGTGRVVVLLNRLGVSRNGLKATLTALDELGLASPNPGYGHPLRPEIVLTDRGGRVATACALYAEALTDPSLMSRKWTASVMFELDTCSHFNELQHRLDVSPRSLSMMLRELVGAGLVLREVEAGHPPRSRYTLSTKGSDVSHAARSIAHMLIARSQPR